MKTAANPQRCTGSNRTVSEGRVVTCQECGHRIPTQPRADGSLRLCIHLPRPWPVRKHLEALNGR